MNTTDAVVLLANLTSAAITSLQNAQNISTLIQKAQAEGRTTFTTEEWAQIIGADDAARRTLQDAIDKA